jgi:hypothetical protein
VSARDRAGSLGRAARWVGLLAVAGNLLGVGFLWNVPSPYRPGDLAAWRGGLLAHPVEAILSATTFTMGLVLIAVFAALLAAAARAERPGWLLAGAALIAGGALLDAAGTLAPVVVVRFLPAGEGSARIGEALLALTLLLDSTFNVLLGLGLTAVSASLGRSSGWPGWHRALGVVAGLASIPVGLQAFSDAFARLLALTAPLWLAWIAAASLSRLWTGREPPAP